MFHYLPRGPNLRLCPKAHKCLVTPLMIPRGACGILLPSPLRTSKNDPTYILAARPAFGGPLASQGASPPGPPVTLTLPLLHLQPLPIPPTLSPTPELLPRLGSPSTPVNLPPGLPTHWTLTFPMYHNSHPWTPPLNPWRGTYTYINVGIYIGTDTGTNVL